MNDKLKPILIWLTGLPGSGKTTLAQALADRLKAEGRQVVVLDGDALRRGISRDLGFSDADRRENIRRAGAAAQSFLQAGFTVIAALVSPFRDARDAVRQLLPANQFLEIHLDCPLETCQARDPKNLYRKAHSGEIQDLTGIQSPYQPPFNPELRLDTSQLSIAESVSEIFSLLK